MGIYAATRLVSVPIPITGAAFAYGFRTKIDATSSTALGHTAVTDANLSTTIFGINHPKPRRATKDFAAPRFSESSFIAAGSITAALADGWKLLPVKRRSYVGTTRTAAVFVLARCQNVAPLSTQTYKFGWRMPDQQFDLITEAERTALGIEVVTGSMTDVVWGVTDKRNRPARAKKRINVAGDDAPGTFSTLTTFVAHNKEGELPSGWS